MKSEPRRGSEWLNLGFSSAVTLFEPLAKSGFFSVSQLLCVSLLRLAFALWAQFQHRALSAPLLATALTRVQQSTTNQSQAD